MTKVNGLAAVRMIVLDAVVAALALGASAMEATNLAAVCERTPDGVRCVRDGKVVWSFSTAKGKPCVHPLHLPDGTPLTASEDADHPWHRGLWFCWKFLNGVNYWETDANGLSKGEQRVVSAETECRGASATVRLTLAWGPRAEPFAPVLDERRTIAFSAPRDDGSYEIVWRARFTARERVEIERTPPYRRKDGTWGGGYAGFSLRLEQSFAAAAKTMSSCGVTGQVDVVAREERWIDYSDDMHGGIRLEALKAPDRTTFYHWTNRRFTNLSPIFDKPLTLERGETLELAYRVSVHGKRMDILASLGMPRLGRRASRPSRGLHTTRRGRRASRPSRGGNCDVHEHAPTGKMPVGPVVASRRARCPSAQLNV